VTNEVLFFQPVSVDQAKRAVSARRKFIREETAYDSRANDEDRAVTRRMPHIDAVLRQIHQSWM